MLEPIPTYQRFSWNERTYQALVTLFAVTLRPFDLIFDKVHKINIPNVQIKYHLTQAFALITDPVFRRKWLQDSPHADLLYVEPVIDDMVWTDYFQELDSMINSPQNSDSLTNFLDKREIGQIGALRKRASSLVDVRNHLHITAAARLLRLSRTDVEELIRESIIRPIEFKNPMSNLLFDVRELNSLNTRLLANTQPLETHDKPLQLLSNLLHKLSYFHLSKGKLIALLVKGEIGTYAARSAAHWHQIFVREIEFLGWLESVARKTLPPTLPSVLLPQVVGLEATQYFQLMHTQYGRSSGRSVIWAKSKWILQFCEDFIVLNRIAEIYGLETMELKEKLLENNVNPIQIFETERPILLYENSPACLKIIDIAIKKLLN